MTDEKLPTDGYRLSELPPLIGPLLPGDLSEVIRARETNPERYANHNFEPSPTALPTATAEVTGVVVLATDDQLGENLPQPPVILAKQVLMAFKNMLENQITAGSGIELSYNSDDVTLTVAAVTSWNPTTKSARVTLSNGNLTVASDGNETPPYIYGNVRSTRASLGKRYLEARIDGRGGELPEFGVSWHRQSDNDGEIGGVYGNVALWVNGSLSSSAAGYIVGYASPASEGDIIQVAFDTDRHDPKIWFGVNGAWVGDPITGTGGTALPSPVRPLYAAAACGPSYQGTGELTVFFKDFNYDIPTGFMAF